MTGLGVATYPGGDRYEGNFAKGKREGQGKLTYATGEVAEGMWRAGILVAAPPEVSAVAPTATAPVTEDAPAAPGAVAAPVSPEVPAAPVEAEGVDSAPSLSGNAAAQAASTAGVEAPAEAAPVVPSPWDGTPSVAPGPSEVKPLPRPARN